MIFGAARPRRPRTPPRTSRRAPPAAAGPLPPKLIPAIRAIASTAGTLVHTRLALAGVELEEEVQRFVSVAVLGVVAFVFALLGLIVGTFTIVAAVPADYRVGTMLALTVLYFVIVLVAALRVRNIFATRPPLFSATLAELDKDRETLAAMNRAHREAEEREHAAHSGEDAFAAARRTGASAQGAT